MFTRLLAERQQIDEARHDWRRRMNEPRFDPKNGQTKVNDMRGLIESICHDPVNSIIRIESKAGSIRSNHYHLTDWHICYVISGEMDYYERPVGTGKPTHRKVLAGEYVRTGPMMEHTTIFPYDTVMLVFAGNARDQDNYERDLVYTADLSLM